jgi:uroporphyrinogen-III synthase
MPTKKQPVVLAVTYEFDGFPVEYYRAYRGQKNPNGLRYRGWQYGPLSRFTFSSLKEAKRMVDRLRRVYQLTGRANLLKDESLLKIERVQRTRL